LIQGSFGCNTIEYKRSATISSKAVALQKVLENSARDKLKDDLGGDEIHDMFYKYTERYAKVNILGVEEF
jgi:hypothetical protein